MIKVDERKIDLKKLCSIQVRKATEETSLITIPKKLKECMNLKNGDILTFCVDPNDNSYVVAFKGVEKYFGAFNKSAWLGSSLTIEKSKEINK